MSAEHVHWVLTDIVHADKWVDTFSVMSHQLPGHHPATPWKITKRTLQGGMRHGVDLIELDNGPLQLSILPTRGMGIWKGSYQGIRLGWDAPIHGPVHPSMVRLEERGGLGWLTGFNEWICRCGLGSNGPPGKDGDKQLTLHGRIANQPAHFVGVRVDQGPPFTLMVVGRVEEACLFGGHLHLTSSISTTPGSNRFRIYDVVENRSTQPAEMQLLYHCNFGPPLLEAGSKVHVPAERIAPRDQRAAGYTSDYTTYARPTPGLNEFVNYYQPRANSEGQGLALLHTADGTKGCAIRFSQKTLPWFAVWKNTDDLKEGYVTGLEPGTGFPNFKAVERKQGRVVMLQPGEIWEDSLEFELHADKEGVEKVLQEAGRIQGSKPPEMLRKPNPEWGG